MTAGLGSYGMASWRWSEKDREGSGNSSFNSRVGRMCSAEDRAGAKAES